MIAQWPASVRPRPCYAARMEWNVGAARRNIVRWGTGALVMVATATSPEWAMAEGATAPNVLEPEPAGAEALRAKLVAALRPDARAKLPATTAAYLAKMKVKDAPFAPEAVARDVLVTNAHLGYASRATSDVEALALVVLLEASREAEQDLRAAMERVAEMNRHKQAVRDAITQCKRDRACLKDAKPPVGITKATFDRLVGIELDGGGLGPTAEANQIQVQMKQDRRRKLLEAVSNLMKKLAQTSEGIVGNMK